LSLIKLKLRIRKNEGYSNKPYKDQLGFYTIGYGHLIKKNEKKYFNYSFKKKHFVSLFESDFKQALHHYKQSFFRNNHNKKEKELLIEMLFQLGPKSLLNFKKMLFYLNKKQKHMACLEMIDSLWYKQTPRRVENLIRHYINN
tara:strand:+ start:4821 stop:5249 length:429 start_codon:yes stop_codon:yes gene_type:complete